MESSINDKDMIATQIIVGGIENYVTAKMLLEYFEANVGLVYRCRLKTSSKPPDSYPNYEVDTELLQKKNGYVKVEPHAFVHFALARSAQLAVDAAGRGELILGRKPLKVCLGRTTTPHKLSDVCLEIGVLKSQYEFIIGWRAPCRGVDFLIDPFNGTCKLTFTKDTAFSIKGAGVAAIMKCDFKLEFLPREIIEIKHCKTPSSLVVLLQLASAPLIYYRTAEDDIEVPVPFDLLDDDDLWIRTTDITPSGAIGRCNTYRISVRPRCRTYLPMDLKYLQNCGVPVHESPIDLHVQDELDFGSPMTDHFFSIPYKAGINFSTRFLLNAVMHKGIINQHQMSEKFYNLLRSQTEELNTVALKHMYSYKHPINDAFNALESVSKWLLNNPKIIEGPRKMNDTVEVRRLIITPTKAYCLPPELELTNRVLRNYRHLADRFLRVTFMDEAMQTLNRNVLMYYPSSIARHIISNSNQQRTTMFKRVRDILYDGFDLCGRHYSFLAFSQNQLRDRSTWFFAEDRNIGIVTIKKWMGKFTDKNVAKHAARIGQCFSSTYAAAEVPSILVNFELDDIKRNGHTFSDGIGMISSDLANEVSEKLQLTTKPPCAYQIRYAGYKGVVALAHWPEKIDGFRLYLRPSMKKFDSNHTILEICSWTRFQPLFLNREIVTLLSALEVQDDVFSRIQDTMVSRLDLMLEDTNMAFDVITSSCIDQGDTTSIMLSAGFKPQTEPHLRGMLASIRAAQLRDLRERARIFVPSGRWLIGCLDELGLLEHGQCFIQISNPSLEDRFVKHAQKKLQVIEGLVAIAKNPCLHPGDVRILRAVDEPKLHHLFDCLVFPQKGDRPHADEASGSDLDGDGYFVTWDDSLIPPSGRSWPPMEYAPGEVKQLSREVTHTDIIEFFAKSMVSDSLGTICHAHVVHADLSEYGAMDEKCIKLAELAATAVDFPKTGKLVKMPHELKPKNYPDFMEKEEFQTYKSTKILGKLYRKIKDSYDTDPKTINSEHARLVLGGITYDQELEITGSESFITDGWNCKCSYDVQLIGLLEQYKVNSEEELVTGHIWSMPKYSGKKRGELKERLKHAYSTLRKDFRKVFECMGPEFEQLSDDEKHVMYERKASAWYIVTYHESWLKRTKELDDGGKTVMLSFAWIASDYLARIKIRCRRTAKTISKNKPIDSLGRYLADKI